MRRVPAATVLAVSLLACLAACSSSGTGGSRPSSAPLSGTPATSTSAPSRIVAPTTSAVRSRSAPAPTSAAVAALASMSERERVGQLLMVVCSRDGVPDATRAAVADYHVGSVILLGGSEGVSMQGIQRVSSTLRNLAPSVAGLFIATDQEGGLVQRLQGPGFDRIPSAVSQGGMSSDTLRRDAERWGTQLRAAGINLNLAPVLDVVPPGGRSNPPIGDLNRQYGSTPATVTSHGLAFEQGMTEAGIDVTVKHFPGLGRVSGNTDTTSGVTDSVTTADDPNLAPFRAAIGKRVPFVMMSTAIYSRIDPGSPAAFSKQIVTDLLRDRLGFGGVVISDDVGAAAQVSNYSPGERAVRFVAAGGDMVLTVVASQAQAMTSALVSRAQSDPAFKQKIDRAALRVLQAKQARGLLH
ncbi:MAG: glycoside hydrolase family 3 N-terminal domain-containing protein [Jatrophihabitans sp.]